jgi:hypothetical protein
MVAKGTILSFVTDFFVDFLATGSVDDLVSQVLLSQEAPAQVWRTMICSQDGPQGMALNLRSLDEGHV